jgi:cupin 2 domain-containing protein
MISRSRAACTIEHWQSANTRCDVNNGEGGTVPKNLLDEVPPHLPEELVQTLLSAPKIRIERIVSHGHCSPAGFWYDQDKHEWVLLISGAARLRFEGEKVVEMGAGDFVNIPAHKRHRVEWTDPQQPTIWLAIHYS